MADVAVVQPSQGSKTSEFLLAAMGFVVGVGAFVFGLVKHDQASLDWGGKIIIGSFGGYAFLRTGLKFVPQVVQALGYFGIVKGMLPANVQGVAQVAVDDLKQVLGALVSAQAAAAGAPLPPGAQAAADALKAAVTAPVAPPSSPQAPGAA